MTYEEVNDDFHIPKPPFRVVACLAVHGRLPLLKHTIERLYKKNGCYKVVCAGDTPADRKLCEENDAIWVQVRNKPLGNKWNQSFYKAREFNPDACLFVGSSDFVSDNWFQIMRPYVEIHGFAGVPGCTLIDISETLRGCHWKGYDGYHAERADETIGSGRMLSRRLLDAIGWLPFNSILDNSMDRSMKDNGLVHGFTDYMVYDDRLKSLSLSTSGPYTWPKGQENKHKFWMHYNDLPNGSQMIPSQKINAQEFADKYFPEVNLIFK